MPWYVGAKGDIFGSPDGAWFDQRGVLWVQTDISTSTINAGDYKNIGNIQMQAFDPKTGIGKRFIVGPKGCEVTGGLTTPDHKTMFVNIQHPGEEPSNKRTDPANPKRSQLARRRSRRASSRGHRGDHEERWRIDR